MKHRMNWAVWASLLVVAVGLAGCGTPEKSNAVPGTAMGSSAANVPAVVQAVPTGAASVESTPIAPAGVTASWKSVQRSDGALTYTYLYPPGWTSDLTYCAPGSARNATGNELPAGCVSTDLLIGQKAKDVGTLTGTSLTLNGKQAVRQISDNPRNTMASRIYTVMLYDATGAPLAGLSSTIGPNTTQAIRNNISNTLDKIAATFTVGR